MATDRILRTYSEPSLMKEPEHILWKVACLQVASHHFHLNTTSFELHNVCDFLYTEISSMKDDISETLLGYIPRQNTMEPIKGYTYTGKDSVIALCREIQSFSREAIAMCKSKGWSDLENLFADFMRIGTHGLYKASLV